MATMARTRLGHLLPGRIQKYIGYATQKAHGVKPDKKSAAPEPEALSAQAQELAKSDWAKGWAAIDPKLGGIDLRPYVFVTRDKRGYSAGFGTASHLENIVERLLGTRMVARSAASEVAKLVGQDPEHVFDALVARIVESDKYTIEPEGVQGSSMKQALAGEQPLSRQAALTENDDDFVPMKVRTITTGDWRLSYYFGQEFGELYDRKNDPDEMTNLWDNTLYDVIKAELMGMLMEEVMCSFDVSNGRTQNPSPPRTKWIPRHNRPMERH